MSQTLYFCCDCRYYISDESYDRHADQGHDIVAVIPECESKPVASEEKQK